MKVKTVYLKMSGKGTTNMGEELELSLTQELVPEISDGDIRVAISKQLISMYQTLTNNFNIDINTTKIVKDGKPYGERTLKESKVVEKVVEKPKSSSPFTKIAKGLQE